ncbi:MAG: phosphotransferase [Clostridia bacterium]|nr:phosphotransferase [Clostridia bacterium]
MIIKLSGRIDSSNAAETEAKIAEQIGAFDGEIVLDAGELEYISSAGLRVILRLKKSNASTKVINCNSEVYEIFDMTGFTEMMEISKAYRNVSVEGCEVIGEGANGIVYRTDPDTIVKVYKNPDSLEEIHNERELARKAFVMGIPTAIPYDVVRVGNLYGSVFELLSAKSFAKLINEGVDVGELAKQSVEILKTMHSTELKPGELPDKKKESLKWVGFTSKQLPEEIGAKLTSLFDDIPDTNNMLHGDFHVKNIMQQNGENLLIDMDTLSMGHPIYELAAVFAAYVGFSCVNKFNAQEFLGIKKEACDKFWSYTLLYYFDGKDEDFRRSVENMAAIICYTRLTRWFMTKKDPNDEYVKSVIEFCKNYLCENVPKTDKLYF